MFEQAFKNIDDVLWKDAGCTSELDYTEQSSWLLFLKYLDAQKRLSVQDHPTDKVAKEMGLAGPAKTEAWVVLDAVPGSRLWAGFCRSTATE